MYLKRVFLHNMLLKIIKTLSTAKIRSELYKGTFLILRNIFPQNTSKNIRENYIVR